MNERPAIIGGTTRLAEMEKTVKSKSLVIGTAVLAFGLTAWSAQEEKPLGPSSRHRVFNFSLAFPEGTNPSKQDTANLSLSIFYGHLGSVRGLDMSLGVAALERSLEGVQTAGLLAVAGETMKGGQVAGLLSVAGDRGEGFQLAGLGSVGGEDFTGVQIAGLFGAAGERLKGVQIAGLFSVAGESARGLQASGLFSVAGDYLDGVQLAGLFNVAGEDSRALQFAGLMNITGGTCNGLQFGLFNVAGKLRGVQIGLVNAAGEVEGLPIGLVNLTRKEDRRIRLAAWLSSVTFLNPGLKIRAKRFYSVLYLGGWNLSQGIEKSLGYGFHYGYSFPIRASGRGEGRKRIDIDAGYIYLDNASLFSPRRGTPDRHVLSLRSAYVYELAPPVSLVAGLGLGYRVDRGTGFSGGTVFPLVFAGLELF
jgi:hypothetical protein